MSIDIAFIIAAFSIGFLGSFHCIGMCGAIALSLPVQHLDGWKKYIGIVLYNIGRVLTYSLLGALFGWLGSRFALFGWQQAISVGLGIIMLLVAVMYLLQQKIHNAWIDKVWNQRLIKIIAPLFQSKSLGMPMIIGLLNGLLPCGLVYIAISGATATSDPILGALFMGSFGLGTLPAMLLIALTGQFIAVRYRNMIRKVSPIVIGCMGLLLLLRGLNLNIPYISPSMEEEKVECCH